MKFLHPLQLLCWSFFLLPASAMATPQTPSPKETAATPAALSMAGWTADERLALGLYQLSLGHMEEALATLSDPKDAKPEAATAERVQRAAERTRQLIAARDQMMRWAIDNKKKLRWPTGDGMVVLKPKTWADGVLTVGKSSKHELTELRAQDMTMAFLAANFKKKSQDLGAPWLKSYCLCLGGQTNWQGGLPKKYSPPEHLMADLADIPARIAAGPGVQALMDSLTCTSENPADFAGLAKTLADTPCLQHRKSLLYSIAQRTFEAQVRDKGLAATLNGKVEDLGEGRIRITYAFDEPGALLDFHQDDRWWKEERENYEAQPETSAALKVEKGSLWLQGKHSLAHALLFEGDMSLEMISRQQVNRQKPSRGAIIGAINASPPFHFARSSFDILIAIEGSTSKPAIKELGPKQKPLRLSDGLRSKLWSKDQQAHLEFHGNPVVSVPFQPKQPGTALIWVHSLDPIGIEQFILEGHPTADSIQALARTWMQRKLEALKP